jgi:hypothetical protein
MANYIKPVSRWGLIRAAFLNKWVAVVTVLSGIIGILDFVDIHVVPKIPTLKPTWDRFYVLPHLRWYVWFAIILTGLFLAGLEGAYRFAKHYYEVALRIDDTYCKSRVNIEYLQDEPGFLGLTQGGKSYRILRVRVTNVGGERLYNLKAQIRLANRHYSYSGDDLTLMGESLPIIQRILYRPPNEALPRPRTTFSLHRGDHQFVNVAMQRCENGKWADVELCLSAIATDNYGNVLGNLAEPLRFTLIVLGELETPAEKDFELYMDESDGHNRLLRMREITPPSE